MKIKVNSPYSTHSRTCRAIHRALWERLKELYPETHLSIDVQAGGPVGSVYTLCHAGDPEQITKEAWFCLEQAWRTKVPSVRCPGCGRRIWRRRVDTPLELALMADSRGEPVETLITPERQHNWRVLASQHAPDCVCIKTHGLAPFTVNSDVIAMIVQAVPEEDRIRPVPLREYYNLAVATAMHSSNAINRSQRLLANEKRFERTDHLILEASAQRFPHLVAWAETHYALRDWESHENMGCPVLPGGRLDDRESRATRTRPLDAEEEERFAAELEQWFHDQGIFKEQENDGTATENAGE